MGRMSICTAHVPTASASRYLQQLCKHWSHKFTVEFDAASGVIHFDSGATLGMAAGDALLLVTLEAGSPEEAARMRPVVEDHLNRFAFREAPLSFAWELRD